MSNETLLAIDEGVETDDPLPIVRERWIRHATSAAVVISLVTCYVIVVRASDRVQHLVDLMQRFAPHILLGVGLVAAAAWRFVPASARALLTRARSSPATGPLVLASAVALCITPALVSWLNGGWAYSKIGGAIPWSDANGYHIGGLRLLNQGQLDDFSMSRPLNAGFYALRMSITGQNFWAAMLLQAVLVGAAGLLFVSVIARHLGLVAGLASAAVLFVFVAPMIDLALTEPLGLTIGCLAVAALCEGVLTHRSWLFSLGLFTLTVALNVRAGAYFVLPALLIWLAVDTLRAHQRFWRPMLTAFGAVVAGFVAVLPIKTLYGNSKASMNGNFSLVLYGLAKGGIGWFAAQNEFAGRGYTSQSEATNAIYRAALHEIRVHPGNFVRGVLSGYSKYFHEGIYGFASGKFSGILLILMLAGWVMLLSRGPYRRLGTMALTAWVGVLLSVPFLFSDGGFRVMAVVVPILAIPPAAGVALIARGLMRGLTGVPPVGQSTQSVAGRPTRIAVACVGSILVLVVGPPIAIALRDSPNVPQVTCAAGRTPVIAEIGRNAPHVTVLPPGQDPQNFGEITFADFHADGAHPHTEMGTSLGEISAGSVLVAAYNLVPGSTGSSFVVVPEAQFPRDRHLVSLCGRLSDNPQGAHYGLVFADHLEVLDP